MKLVSANPRANNAIDSANSVLQGYLTMLLKLLVEKIFWRFVDHYERNSKVHRQARLQALEEFNQKHWDVQYNGSSHDVGLYYIQYLRDKVPVCKVYHDRKYALKFYEECLVRSDVSQVNCRRLTTLGNRCSFEYLYQQVLNEEDYKSLNPNVANVVLALAWFYEHYGTEHDIKYPTNDLDKELFLTLVARGVFDSLREPDDPHDLLYDGTDYLWEGWELSQALRSLGITPVVNGWRYFYDDINPFSTLSLIENTWAMRSHYEMLEDFLNHTYKIDRRHPVGNFDIWRIGKLSGELERRYGRAYVEKLKMKKKDRWIEWYINKDNR